MTSATSHRYPSPFRAWYLVVLLTIAYVFSFVDKYLPALLIEPIKQDLGASDTQMGLLLGPAFAILYATLGLPLGWLADRVRRNTLVAAGKVYIPITFENDDTLRLGPLNLNDTQ